jgi:TatD DNase family protein
MIDAHCHLERYPETEQQQILASLDQSDVKGIVTVAMDLASCQRTQKLAVQHPDHVYPCYGYHPEQSLPTEAEFEQLQAWIIAHADKMVAIGEVGLPYYTRTELEQSGQSFAQEPYLQLLERFIQLANQLDKPIVLHAVYEDAALVCDLLEKHNQTRAHFHWFKGPAATIQRMIQNGYFISITPDVMYEPEIQQLVRIYPLAQMMVETDGPWPFEGPFSGKMTHPDMMHESIRKIAAIKQLPENHVRQQLLANTIGFYQLRNN